jgi:hypothetical protein
MIETEAWLLPSNQHDSEASFVSHHPSVSFCSFWQRNGFDHRTDLLQGAEAKRVRSREPPRFEQEETEGTEIGTKISSLFSLFAPVQSAPATISWPRKLSGLAARSKSSEQWRHGFAICRCREDQSGTAQGLKRGNRLLNLGVNVMMCPEFLRETFLFRSASNGRDSKTHASPKPNSEVAKPTNSLNSDEFAGPGL